MNQRTLVPVSIEATDGTHATQGRLSDPSPLESDPARLRLPRHPPEDHRTVVYFETAEAEANLFLKCAAEATERRVYRAADRTELYRLVLTVDPSLIVLGSSEGKREAIRLVGGLRDMPILDGVPVVFLSDSKTEVSIRTAFALGVTRYILKSPHESERAACILALLSDSEGSASRIDAHEILPGDGAAASSAFLHGRRAWSPVKAAMAPDSRVSSRYPWVYRRFAESPRLSRNV